MAEPMGRWDAATGALAGAGGQDPRHSRLWSHRTSARSAGAGVRHADLCHPTADRVDDASRDIVYRWPRATGRSPAPSRLPRSHPPAFTRDARVARRATLALDEAN